MTDALCLSDTPVPLDEIIDLIRERMRIDLRAYRRSSVERRIASRLRKLGCQSYREYARRLATDPDEPRQLVEHLTIKVSRFFRNAAVFARLREEVIPDLLRNAREDARRDGGEDGGPRFWSAGCARGEEPYTLAIILDDLGAGVEGSPFGPVTIHGTDVDAVALEHARRGVYPAAALEETPPELVARYFARRRGRFADEYELHAALRERVSFARRDLLADDGKPAERQYDLILCRNVLIYLTALAQERVLGILTSSLAPGGYLCLGEAEQIHPAYRSAYQVLDQRRKLYRKIAVGTCRHS